MLSSSSRLRAKRLVAQVYQRGQKTQGEYLMLRSLANRAGKGRVAIVVSRAVSKKATVRNRVKRILGALLSQAALPSADMVISVKRLPKGDFFFNFQKELLRWFPDLRSK